MGEKAELIAAVLLEHGVCLDCLALKASVSIAAAEGYVAVLQRLVRIRRQHGSCDACGRATIVVTLRRDSDP